MYRWDGRRPAFGRPCPPEFVERVHAGAMSQRESWTRAVKASREVVCPILRHGAPSSLPASFSHVAAPGSAPLHRDFACTTSRVYAVTREAILPSCYYEYHLFIDEIIFREREEETRQYRNYRRVGRSGSKLKIEDGTSSASRHLTHPYLSFLPFVTSTHSHYRSRYRSSVWPDSENSRVRFVLYARTSHPGVRDARESPHARNCTVPRPIYHIIECEAYSLRFFTWLSAFLELYFYGFLVP